MIEIVWIRHAQPDWQPEGLARDEPELTALGHAQAERVAEALADETFDRIYTSPLLRARETIAPIARTLGMEPEVLGWMAELRLAELEGTPLEEVQKYFARMRTRELEDWWHGMEGGESFRHFHERVTTGLDELLEGDHGTGVMGEEPYQIWLPHAENQRLLVVAHGGSIAVALAHLLGIPAVPWEAERFSVGWAGISRLRTRRVASGAVWSLTTFNQRAHLVGLADPDEAPTDPDSVAKPGS